MIINHFKLKFYAFLEFFLGPNPNFFGVLYSQIEVIFFNDKLASNTIQVHQDPKFLLSLKQVHQVASRYIKLQASTSRCIEVHQAATKYIKMHPGTSSCIKGHLEHPAALRVILSIHKNVLVHVKHIFGANYMTKILGLAPSPLDPHIF